MAIISKVGLLVSGAVRNQDLATNTLSLAAIQANGSTSGTLTQNFPAIISTYAVVWPSAQGAASTVLGNDGAGNLSWVSSVAGSALDGTFRIQNTAAPTKQIAFSAAGITAGQTRTITMPDANVDLGALANGNISASAAIDYSKLAALTSGSILVGSAGGVATVIAMSGEATIIAAGTVTLSNAAVIAKVLTGYTSGAGTVAATDSILSAIQKLNGNDALKLPLAGGTMSGQIAMGGSKITGLGAPTANGDALRFDQIGAINGIAGLDGAGKVPLSQLPSALMEFQGNWNPTTNTPALIDGTGTIGFTYWVSALKTTAVTGLNDASMVNFQIGDLIIYNGTVWVLVTPAAGVQSVNGSQGAVTVNAINQLSGDVTTSAASGSQSLASTIGATKVVTGMVNTNVFDQVTITGGAGSAAAVTYSPLVKTSEIAGETFAASLFAVRIAKAADAGFVAGRMYKADNDATTVDNFYVIGLVNSAASAAGAILVTKLGEITVTAHGFTVGAPLFLGAAGIVTATAPTAVSTAVVRVGIAKTANIIELNLQVMGVN